jgi:DNA helicase-2/ATP-dependent DNA helicase PcrA
VQVLTIHTAKGLEWDRVFVPFVVGGTFPSGQGRERWTSNAQGFPYPLRGDADVLPRLSSWTSKGLSDLGDQFKQDALGEEVRLAYVAFTRARSALHVSGHWWGRTQVKPRAVSEYLDAAAAVCAEQGRPTTRWSPPPTDSTNPELQVVPVAWPRPQVPRPRRERAAELVRAARAQRLVVPAPNGAVDEEEQLDAVAAIDEEIAALREAAASDQIEVPLPASLSTTAVLDLVDDERTFARSLARPMPRRPSTAARFGTKFHAWVESHFGLPVLLDPTELPGRGDADLGSDAELDRVREIFLAGPYAERKPVAIEAPFSLMIGGQQVMGRIDAVFSTDDGVEVVDWKTNASATADPLQLAIYRLAWAELHQLPLDQVSAAFYYVRLGEVDRFGPTDLPDRAELERRLA